MSGLTIWRCRCGFIEGGEPEPGCCRRCGGPNREQLSVLPVEDLQGVVEEFDKRAERETFNAEAAADLGHDSNVAAFQARAAVYRDAAQSLRALTEEAGDA